MGALPLQWKSAKSLEKMPNFRCTTRPCYIDLFTYFQMDLCLGTSVYAQCLKITHKVALQSKQATFTYRRKIRSFKT